MDMKCMTWWAPHLNSPSASSTEEIISYQRLQMQFGKGVSTQFEKAADLKSTRCASTYPCKLKTVTAEVKDSVQPGALIQTVCATTRVLDSRFNLISNPTPSAWDE